MQPLLGEATFPLCALDMAAHDLWGKLRGPPVWKLWGLSIDRLPPTDYTIGIDTIDTMVAKLDEFPGLPVYKIKLGTADDLEIVRELRRHTDAVFRVDANCAWDVDETIRNAEGLKELGVEFIEQPLPPDDWQGMRRGVSPSRCCRSSPTKAAASRRTWTAAPAISTASTSSWSSAAA